MAQRNPMNQRYAGDGPKGQTRKSAAKLKPKSEAAASVHIDKKPVTRSERKAASKRRASELARKEEERRRKSAERERAEKEAKIAAGELPPEPAGKKAGGKTFGQKAKALLIGDSNKSTTGKAESKPAQGRPGVPKTPEYKKLKKIYWVLMAVGIVAVALSFLMQYSSPDALGGTGWVYAMVVAYICIIAAIVLDYSKIRKMVKAHNQGADPSKMSPKQLKHEERKTEAANILEKSKQTQRELRRANSKIPLYRKPLPGEKIEAADDSEDKE